MLPLQWLLHNWPITDLFCEASQKLIGLVRQTAQKAGLVGKLVEEAKYQEQQQTLRIVGVAPVMI